MTGTTVFKITESVHVKTTHHRKTAQY